MKPAIGRIVHYKLSAYDVEQIHYRRSHYAFPGGAENEVMRYAYYGNGIAEGDIYPALIVRTFSGTTVNLQVQLDGNDAYWATSRAEGDSPGQWHVPERVPEDVFRTVSTEEQLKALSREPEI